MTIINQKSISGITSITFASAGDDLLTFHSNNGTERFRIDNSGNTKITAGIVTTLTVTGNSTLSSNKSQFDSTGTLYLNSGGSVGSGNYYTKIGSDGSADFLSNISIADKIIHYGDTNTAIRFPAADTVTVETAGTEALRVDSSQKLLIGTTSSQGHASGNLLEIGNYTLTNAGITINNPTNGAGLILFGDSSSTNRRGRIEYNHTADAFRFYTADSERLRITSAGLVGIGTDTPGAILEVFDATSNTILNVKSGDAGATINLIDDSARSSIEQNGTTLKIISDTGAEDASSDIRLQVDGSSKMIIRDSGDIVTGVPGDDNQNHTGSRTVFTVADTTNGALLHLRGQSPAAFFDISSSGIGKVFLDGADFAIKSGTPASEGSERLRIRSGGGLTFNGDTAAANALDDYEEGTWTPTAGTNMGTLTGATGGYTKIGRLVYVNFGFTTSSVSTSANSKIGGLPFNPNDIVPNTSVESTGLCFVDDRFYSMQVQGGTSNIIIETDRPLQGSASSGSQFLRGAVVFMTDE